MRLTHFFHAYYNRLRAIIAREVTPALSAAFPSTELEEAELPQFEQARLFHQAGQLSEAEKLYEALLRVHPKNVELMHLLGMTHGQRNNFTVAIAYFERAIACDPKNAPSHSGHGNCLKGLGRHEAALTSYDKALALRPDDADTWSNRGATLTDLRRPEEALRCFDSALAIAPDHVPALDNRATTLRELGRLEAALASHGQVLAISPEYAPAHDNLGITLRALERHAEARSSHEQAIALGLGGSAVFCNLGAACTALGQYEVALASFDRALAFNPNDPATLNNRGAVLYSLARYEDALTSYERALITQPDHVEALRNKSTTLRTLNRHQDALAAINTALEIDPSHAITHNSRGITLKELNRHGEALASFDRALALSPDYVDALVYRGHLLHILKRYDEALECFEAALKIHPANPGALNDCGATLHALDRHDDALIYLSRALELKPDFAEALGNYGGALNALKRHDEALNYSQRAVNLKPDNAEAFFNCGAASYALNRHEAALEYYDHALKLNSNHETLVNRGLVLADLRRLEEALESYDRALKLKPDSAKAHLNISLCRLQLGDFTQGWRGYEWRWEDGQLKRVKRNFSQRLWLGLEPLNNKTILLHAEQGFGDTIQFCRYVKEVAALGAKVVLEVQRPLLPLLQNVEGTVQVIAHGAALPEFDLHCPLLSMPLALKTTLNSIPKDIPYIRSDVTRVQMWKNRLGKKSKPRLGIVWCGNATHNNDGNRNIASETLLPLLCDKFEWISLQKEVRESEVALLAAHTNIRHFGEQLTDFSDTAALIELMDLVLTVDTSVMHLAGAMGKNVWVLLPFNADWRWLLERDDSPWYPSARLFRQPTMGAWKSVIARVGEELLLQ